MAAEVVKMSTAAVSPTYVINLAVTVKRSKEELDFAHKEADRLHELIKSDKEVSWAKEKIAELHKLIFSPNVDQIKHELESKLKQADEA